MSADDYSALVGDLGDWIQERSAAFLTTTEDEEDTPSAGVVTAFVLVVEWMGDDGHKWVTYHRPLDQAVWLSRGLLSEAITDLP